MLVAVYVWMLFVMGQKTFYLNLLRDLKNTPSERLTPILMLKVAITIVSINPRACFEMRGRSNLRSNTIRKCEPALLRVGDLVEVEAP